MGEAKRRGTFEQRKAIAVVRNAEERERRRIEREQYYAKKYAHLPPEERKRRVINDVSMIGFFTALAAEAKP